jgi:carbon storage regulator
MLVLSRQRDETIMIGDDIEITIVDIRGDKVRLGITAPATIPVHRKEVYDAIQRENREAARMKMEDLGTLPKTMGRPAVPPAIHRPQHARPAAPPRDVPQNGSASGTTPPPSSQTTQAQPGNSAGSVPA